MELGLDTFSDDIRKINQIAIVPTMLEVICRSTGMGFAAIARVTEDRWIACSVRDEIQFGLKEGGELQIETTICNEIRQSRQGVMIDHVDDDPNFCGHHTPKKYGFQSYISMPIILHTGEFFGTLCAIDPLPRKVTDIKTDGMFTMFAQLIAFHLQAMDMIRHTHQKYEDTNKLLTEAKQENKRYEHLTYHSLREPVRKIALHSDLLLESSEVTDLQKIKKSAIDIKRWSIDLSQMLYRLDND